MSKISKEIAEMHARRDAKIAESKSEKKEIKKEAVKLESKKSK